MSYGLLAYRVYGLDPDGPVAAPRMSVHVAGIAAMTTHLFNQTHCLSLLQLHSKHKPLSLQLVPRVLPLHLDHHRLRAVRLICSGDATSGQKGRR